MTTKQTVLIAITLAALVFLIVWEYKPQREPKIVQWAHSGKAVTSWQVCAPDCKAVDPRIVGVNTAGENVYQASLPANHKPPYAIKACNAAGCATTTK